MIPWLLLSLFFSSTGSLVAEQYSGISPQASASYSFEETFPGWTVYSPDPNSEVRQLYKVEDLLGLPALNVGDPFTIPNPFDPSLTLPLKMTGFEFKSGGYGVSIPSPKPLAELFALVSWAQGPMPFIFVQQSADITQQDWDGFGRPDRTEIYSYGNIIDSSGVSHQIAMLRFRVENYTDPVITVYLLQTEDPTATLWGFTSH